MTEEEERIDLTEVFSRMKRGVERGWRFLLLLVGILTMLFYIVEDRIYMPVYTTTATVYVQLAGEGDNSYRDRISAKQMETFIPYLWDSGVLRDAVCKELGQEEIPGDIGLSVSPDTNLLTVQVTGENPDAIYGLLTAFIRVIPYKLRYIVGPVDCITFRDRGIPQRPANRRMTEWDIFLKSCVRGGEILAAGLLLLMVYGVSLQIIPNRKALKKSLNVPVLGSLPHIGERAKFRNSAGARGESVPCMGKRDKSRNSSESGRESFSHIRKSDRERKKSWILTGDRGVPSGFSESVKMIRVRLERTLKKEKVILITSSVHGEGKTLTAVNLAISFMQKGKRVLVIDGSRKSSDAEKMLQYREGQMQRETEMQSTEKRCLEKQNSEEQNGEKHSIKLDSNDNYKHREIQSGQISWISLNCFGDSEGFEESQFARWLEQIRQSVDYILIDAPPVDTGDTLFLSRYADGCLYVVRRNLVECARLRFCVGLLTESGCGILGTVLNDDPEKSGSYYGRRYGYGYGKSAI